MVLIVIALSWSNIIDEKKRDIRAINTEIQRQQNLLKSVKKKEQSALRNLYVINRKLRNLQGNLNQTKRNLQTKSIQVSKTSSALKEIRSEYQNRKRVLNKRIREIYKNQYLGYLGFLFNSESIYDLMGSSYYFEQIIKSDYQNISRLKKSQSEFQQKNYYLTQQQRNIERLKRNISNKKKLYYVRKKDQSQAYSALKNKRKEYEGRIQELKKNSQEIGALIRKLSKQGSLKGLGKGKFIWPIRGIITSPYGYRKHPIFKVVRFHSGIDIAQKYGKKIVAADGGVVIFSGWWGGYGKAIIIDHGRGYTTVYGHTSRIYVSKGDKVSQRQVIGLIGTTGYSTGPHLHFEIRKDGKTRNPMEFLK